MKKFLLLIIVCGAISNISAQISNIVNANITKTLVSSNTIPLDSLLNVGIGLDSLLNLYPANIVVSLQLSDTTNADSLHIQLGRVLSGVDVVELHLAKDGSNLPSGMVLFKEDYIYYLQLGQFNLTSELYLRAWVSTSTTQSSIYSLAN